MLTEIGKFSKIDRLKFALFLIDPLFSIKEFTGENPCKKYKGRLFGVYYKDRLLIYATSPVKLCKKIRNILINKPDNWKDDLLIDNSRNQHINTPFVE